MTRNAAAVRQPLTVSEVRISRVPTLELSDMAALRAFEADVAMSEDAYDPGAAVGVVRGLLGLHVVPWELEEAGDEISAEAFGLGAAAAALIAKGIDEGDLVDPAALLIESMRLPGTAGGRPRAGRVVGELAEMLMLAPSETVVVLMPEPQQAHGGAYPAGAAHDHHLGRLVAAVEQIGFMQFEDTRLWGARLSDLDTE